MVCGLWLAAQRAQRGDHLLDQGLVLCQLLGLVSGGQDVADRGTDEYSVRNR